MSLGFPTNPSVGDLYTVGSTTYIWDGIAWLISSTVVTATSVSTTGTVTIGSTASSTGTDSGALIVSGGTGVGGNLYVGGITVVDSITGTTFTFTTGTVENLLITTDLTVDGNTQVQSITGTDFNFTTGTVENLLVTTDLTVDGNLTVNGDTRVQTITGTDFNFTTGTVENLLVTTDLTVDGNTQVQSITGTDFNFTTGTVENLYISSEINSTGTDSGALVVAGGAGIGGDLYIGGSIYASATGTVISFTTGTFQQLYVNGGTSATSTTTGDLIVSGGVGVGGDLWVSGDIYSGGQKFLTTSSFNTIINSGPDIDISIQEETNAIIISNTSTLETVTSRGSSTTNIVYITNTTDSTGTNSGALVVSGGVGISGRLTAESVKISDAIIDSSQTSINSTDTTVIDSFDLTEFRSTKYLIQIDEGIGQNADFELIEILLVADNNGRVWATEYGVVTSNGYLGEFSSEIIGNDVNLYFTAYNSTNKLIKVLKTSITS